MGRGEIDKKKDDKVEATLCPSCSYEHVIVPMFRVNNDNYHCLLCKTSFVKRLKRSPYLFIVFEIIILWVCKMRF